MPAPLKAAQVAFGSVTSFPKARAFLKQRTSNHGACHTLADRVSFASPDLHSLIAAFDTDGDGRLTIAEAQKALEAWQDRQGRTATQAAPADANGTTRSAASTSKPSQPTGPVTWDLQIVNGIAAARSAGKGAGAALLSYMRGKLSNSGKARASASDMLWSFCGMFLAVAALGVMNLHVRSWPIVGEWHQQGLGLLLGSFGTLCVLIFGRPEAEAVRVWNLLAGHVVATATVLTLLHVLGPGILSRALAMACMIATMLFTDSVHPPGGALVLMAVDSAAIQRMDWWFMLYPSLTVTIAVLLPIGVLVNWLKRNVRFDFPSSRPSSATAGVAPSTSPSPLPELRPKMA